MSETSFRLSPLHRAWRLLPVRHRRALLTRVSAALAPRATLPPPGCTDGVIVAGEISRASGLGESARLMLQGLRQLGVPCWSFDLGPFMPAYREELAVPERERPPAGAALVIHVNPPLLPMVLRRMPRQLVRGRRIVGYWAWELERAPSGWEMGARHVHEAWAPSRFTAAAVEPLLPGRVRVVPHFVGAQTVAADRRRFAIPPDAMVTLASFNLASSFVRKNPVATIRAFQTAFGERVDRVLILKAGNPDHFPDDFARLSALTDHVPNIRIMTETLTHEDTLRLTASADIILSLHRSEGFGLVLAEAMALGKPVVATGWSGNMDFMDEHSAALVPFELVPVSDARGVYDVPGAVWAEADIGVAARQLRRLADNPAERAALGARGREAISRLDLSPLAEAIRSLGLVVAA